MFLTRLSILYHLYKAQKSYDKQHWQVAVYHFANVLRLGGELTVNQAKLFNTAKQNYSQSRPACAPIVAVCGWDLSHNAAGRVLTLENLYTQAGYDANIIGCIVQTDRNQSKQLWQPIRLANIKSAYIIVSDAYDLIDKAYRFVCTHPFDIVHLSKPRLPNIIIGRLYQLIWNATVIMDVDDEELGFSTKSCISNSTISPDIAIKVPDKADLSTIRSHYWLTRCIRLSQSFDSLTVSNVALQAKYGGLVFPHVRDAVTFTPSLKLKASMRQRYDIPLTQQVVLFFGTPKPHKGLIETAVALSQASFDDVLFLIIGDFVNPDFKRKLCRIKGVNFKFLPNQPYNQISHFVAMGDVCVCLQDIESIISQHQLPAKIIDALAMGLIVMASPTPALMPLITAGVIVQVTKDNLADALRQAFKHNKPEQIAKHNRDYFLEHLSIQSHIPKLNALLNSLQRKEYLVKPNQSYTLSTLTMHKLP